MLKAFTSAFDPRETCAARDYEAKEPSATINVFAPKVPNQAGKTHFVRRETIILTFP
jgi:hypothetical protein